MSYESIKNQVDVLLRSYAKAIPYGKYRWVNLGVVGIDPLWLLTPTVLHEKRVLFVAGFHGEEPAGCWGLLDFFAQWAKDPIPGVGVSFIPVVNTTGLRYGRRRNAWNESTNCGFVHEQDPQAREGKVLTSNIDLLKILGKDCFVSFHEDIDADGFYLYTFENHDTWGPFTQALYTTGAQFFKPVPDGYEPTLSLKNGVVYRLCDGSMEDLMWHLGTLRTACTETPGAQDFDRRVATNTAFAWTACRYVASLQHA